MTKPAMTEINNRKGSVMTKQYFSAVIKSAVKFLFRFQLMTPLHFFLLLLGQLLKFSIVNFKGKWQSICTGNSMVSRGIWDKYRE